MTALFGWMRATPALLGVFVCSFASDEPPTDDGGSSVVDGPSSRRRKTTPQN